MTPKMKIMAAVDLSEYSPAIVRYSGWLAKQLNAQLVLVNVINQRDLDLVNRTMTGYETFSYPNYVAELEQGRDHLFVARFGRAGEILIGEFEAGSERFPDGGQFVDVCLGILALGLSRLLNLLAVLIQSGQEEGLFAQAVATACDHVGNDLLIGVTQVRRTVDVIDGGGDVEPLVHSRGSVEHGSAKLNPQLG